LQTNCNWFAIQPQLVHKTGLMQNSFVPELFQKLNQNQVKLTRQRKLIIEKIAAFKSPFAAEDLFLRGLKRSGIDLATIYRTLNLFAENNWISRFDIVDGHARYVLKPTSSHLHTLLCKACNRVEHLSGCFVEKQQEELQKKGFTSLSHKVEFIGLCPDCTPNDGVKK
jgi:Fur family transcriptional regulator, ferric uptake regulator